MSDTGLPNRSLVAGNAGLPARRRREHRGRPCRGRIDRKKVLRIGPGTVQPATARWRCSRPGDADEGSGVCDAAWARPVTRPARPDARNRSATALTTAPRTAAKLMPGTREPATLAPATRTRETSTGTEIGEA
jgi:hypothetical protein